MLKSSKIYSGSTVRKDLHFSVVVTRDILNLPGIRFLQEWDYMSINFHYLVRIFRCICAHSLVECNVGDERVHGGLISLQAFYDCSTRFLGSAHSRKMV